ncbi:type 1 glutamine amidotransferase [Streptomyces sp. enrichment culture]|uniref:type 1 glutamine amidotransferase n=1 Tax=Streptomyces sp. enrichment culture TaxID=1795815 RepID=UPI003F544DD8
MARLLVVQNHRGGGPGRFGDWLAAGGVSLDVVHAYAGAAVPRRTAHDGVLVLGGGYLPDDDVRAPWLVPTRALVADALERGAPVFGICLGGQLLAQVAGGTVRGGHGEPEVGSTPLTLRSEAGADPLFAGLPERVTAIEHHRDAVTALPPGAAWLMASEQCPYQAFRVGERAWGVQFHPEAGANRVGSWDAGRLRARGLDPVALTRRAELDEPASEAVWREVAGRFAAVVVGS